MNYAEKVAELEQSVKVLEARRDKTRDTEEHLSLTSEIISTRRVLSALYAAGPEVYGRYNGS